MYMYFSRYYLYSALHFITITNVYLNFHTVAAADLFKWKSSDF